MDKQGPERPDDLAAFAEAYVAAERAAVGAVEATMSGGAIPYIEAALARELRAREVFIGRDEIHLEARRIADPDWARKDPATLRRLLAELSSAAKAREEAALEAQWDRVAERLDQALESMWRLRRSAVTPPDGRRRHLRGPHRSLVIKESQQTAATGGPHGDHRKAVLDTP